MHSPLDALAVAVAEVGYSRESSQGSEPLSTIAPRIPKDLIVATKIKRGRPKRIELGFLSKEKLDQVNKGYQQIVSQIAHDASEDSGGRRRQFVCTVSGCGKVFYQRAHLNIHIRSHTGYKPYACQYPGCGKSFPQLGNMRTHERIHTGDRPFQCNISGCEKAFTQMGNLKTHLKKVHNLDVPMKSRRGQQRHPTTPTEIGSNAAVADNTAACLDPSLVNIIGNHGRGASSTVSLTQPVFQNRGLPPLNQHNLLPASILANAKLSSGQYTM
ncbi:hypothetical protein J3B02_000961 [Coemansia erecta]|uniref:C2H2-type domain-containing protein n=1 Tax=Coemansia asiatica TaxID=1052880 RepID=A0A9W7XRB3_9FUNG|nr:hypothetical protein LPJ64_000758 [Coemansia asiatica]KAJ2857493.1 hypothetical protein J3B02_000961 [Coemansia erecta]